MGGRSLFGDIGSLFNKTPLPHSAGRHVNIFGGGGSNSTKRQMAAYGGSSTLYAIVRKIMEGTADPDWHLYRKKVDGRKVLAPREGDRTEVAVHPALDLWNQPNPFYTQSQFIETIQQHYELTGEMWWLVANIGNTTIPGEIWPIRPDRMEPVPDPEQYLRGYLYTAPDGTKVGLDLDEVIFEKSPNPLDPYRGMGPVASLMLDLEGEAAARQFNHRFFANDATPGGAIEVPDTLGDKEFTRLNDQWEENHRGVGNAHRVVILEKGAKFAATAPTMRDMQFEALRRMATEKVMEAYAMHGHMLGKSADINRANADAAEYTFGKWLIKPRCGRIRGALNGKLLPKYGSVGGNVEFDFDDPTLEDQAAETARVSAMTAAAATLIGQGFDAEETLEALGLPKIKWTKKEIPPPPVFAPREEEAEPELEEAAA